MPSSFGSEIEPTTISDHRNSVNFRLRWVVGPFEIQCGLVAISCKRFMIESKTRNTPTSRNIMILVFHARRSGVGGGLTIGMAFTQTSGPSVVADGQGHSPDN